MQPYRNVTHDSFYSSGLAAWCQRHDAGVAFFSPIRHGLLLGKYTTPTTFPVGDFRNSDKAFADAHILHRLSQNAAALHQRFADRSPEPVLAALIATCLADCDTGTVLLGQRHPGQVRPPPICVAHLERPAARTGALTLCGHPIRLIAAARSLAHQVRPLGART